MTLTRGDPILPATKADVDRNEPALSLFPNYWPNKPGDLDPM